MLKVLFSVPAPAKSVLTASKYRYFVDLKNGAFIYVFPQNLGPPEGWPLIELDAKEVEELLLKEEE